MNKRNSRIINKKKKNHRTIILFIFESAGSVELRNLCPSGVNPSGVNCYQLGIQDSWCF